MSGRFQLGLMAIFGVIALALLDSEPNRPNVIERSVKKLESAVSGNHCLDTRDKTLKALKYRVRDRVRYPERFEHVKTSIAPSTKQGLHDVVMRFRIRNAAGNLTEGVATASVRAADCWVTNFKLPK